MFFLHSRIQTMDHPDPPPRPPQVSSLGIEFALSLIALGWLGWWLDGVCGWRERFPILLVLGVLGGFAWFIWRLKRMFGGPPKP